MLEDNKAIALIQSGSKELGIELTQEQISHLIVFQELLAKWNKTHNLTSITDPTEMLILHVLDSLTIAPYIKSDRVLDVGSGGGLPSMVLAILFPQTQFVSVDSREKKIQFQTLAAAQLGLHNFKAIHSRVQDINEAPFQQIVSRAFSSLVNFTEWTSHLITENGKWLAMKGKLPHDEIKDLGRQPDELHELSLPFKDVERHLLIYNKLKNGE